jgi:hypothetical protein
MGIEALFFIGANIKINDATFLQVKMSSHLGNPPHYKLQPE